MRGCWIRQNKRVEVVIRPEDLEITSADKGKISVVVDTQYLEEFTMKSVV